MSKRICCVVGCSNTSQKKPAIHFYSFPKKSWMLTKREKWISAIRRENEDGTKWIPTTNSRICSEHFIGGEKSEDPAHPSFIPKIFPEQYNTKETNVHSLSKVRRYNRINKRRHQHTEAEETPFTDCPPDDQFQPGCVVFEQTKHASVQTECLLFKLPAVAENTIMVERDGNNVGVQTIIKHVCNVSTSTMTSQTIYNERRRVDMCDKSCGPSIPSEQVVKQIQLSTLPSPLLLDVKCHVGGITEAQLSQMVGVTKSVFELLKRIVTTNKQLSHKISSENCLFMFLMKLKLGLSNTVLSFLFKIGRSQVQTIFLKVLKYLVVATKDWVFWPSKQAIQETMPNAFKDYRTCRAIIDCTELRVEKPSSVEQQNYFYSDYKSTHTLKFLVAVSPSGMFTFVSKAYGGRATDCYITQDSGFLQLVEPGDVILADKGFPQIETDIENQNAILVMPPFSSKGSQFEPEVAEKSYKIARERVHVERAIQRIKIYKILEKVHLKMLPYIDEIIYFCCVLANLQSPIIY